MKTPTLLRFCAVGMLSLSGVMCPAALSLSAGAETLPAWRSPHPLDLERKAPVALLPFPCELAWGKQTDCVASSPGIAACAFSGGSTLWALKEIFPGIRVVKGEPGKGISSVRLNGKLATGSEGYVLRTWPDRFELEAATEAGLFYGLQTLRQLVLGKNDRGQEVLASAEIRDMPAFPHRGFLLDVGRNFMPIDTLKKHIDLMSRFKINLFHWHLTDSPSWRVECKSFPRLNDPQFQVKGRDPGAFYTYDEIRDLIAYARKRHVMVVPELDMPGHSDYFKKAFGFPMESPQGMDVLEKLLDEFCREIPREMCPWLHIGTDECHVPNPVKFAKRMAGKVVSLGRRPMQWKPGLPVADGAVAQLWNDEGISVIPSREKGAYIDSTAGYINVLDPTVMVRKQFFRQMCGQERGDDKALGGIVCLWNDVRADNPEQIERQNPMWPGIMTFAERSWKGSSIDATFYKGVLPPRDSEAFQAFELFEQRLEKLGIGLGRPFPYWPQCGVSWRVTDPVPVKDGSKVEAMRRLIVSGELSPLTKQADGGYLALKTRVDPCGIFAKESPGVTVWCRTELESPADGIQYVVIGFDAPARSNRRCSGIPRNGEWSSFGSRIWVNGQEIKGPNWQMPGSRGYRENTWFRPPNELPFTDEEFWWTREPVAIPVKKGTNMIVIENPFTVPQQNWTVTFIPVRKSGDKWVSALP